jgi:hypothetical protein
LPYVSGTKRLEQQLRAVNSTLHVFGHTHIDRDFVLDGVRYLQQSRKYPREQKYVANVPKSAYHKVCAVVVILFDDEVDLFMFHFFVHSFPEFFFFLTL